jgi:hypothetical protein
VLFEFGLRWMYADPRVAILQIPLLWSNGTNLNIFIILASNLNQDI